MSRSISIATFVCLFAGAASGQPVMENLYVVNPTFKNISPVTEWTDIPETDKTVTVPAGDFSIIWRFHKMEGGGILRTRPVVGDVFPAEGLTSGKGSWVGHTDGGTFTVKFQAIELSGGGALARNNDSSASWTLTVFPDAGPVPAVSTVGLGIMVVLLLAGGAVVLHRRQRLAA